ALLHAEFGRAVLDEHVELLERPLVEQEFDALARGQLAALVLGLDAGLAAAQARLLAPLLQPVEDVFHGSSLLVSRPAARIRPKGITWGARGCRPEVSFRAPRSGE